MPRRTLAAALLAIGVIPLAGVGSTNAQSIDVKREPEVKVAKPTGPSRIERYAKVLGLDAAQKDAAKDLYDAYIKEQQEQGKKMRDAMRDAQDDMNAGDRGGFEKKLGETMAAHREKSAKQTETLLSDLKALLKPEQMDNWPKFERFRRREQYLSSMMQIGGTGMGGSGVDLFPLIDKLGVPANVKPKVDEQLAAYEMDIDRPLKERQQNMEDEQKNMGAIQSFTPESFQKKLDRDRKVDLAIRDVNTTYVRRIAAVLPDDLAKKLDDLYQARAYRSIYKESGVARKVAAAQKLADLSDSQKKQLQTMLDKYKKDAKAANDRWAAAQQKAETDGKPTGGGLMVFTPGDSGNAGPKVDPEVAAARQARRDLDNALKDGMEKVLTPDQLAAIPTPVAPPGMGHRVEVFGDGTGEDMVFAGDVELPDDFEPGMGGGPVMIVRTIEGGPTPHGGGQGGGGGQWQPPADQTRPTEKPRNP